MIAIASRGNRKDVEKTKKTVGITFTLIPGPERKVAESFGVYDREKNRALATVIVDKSSIIRFKHVAKDVHDRPDISKIIEVLQEIK